MAGINGCRRKANGLAVGSHSRPDVAESIWHEGRYDLTNRRHACCGAFLQPSANGLSYSGGSVLASRLGILSQKIGPSPSHTHHPLDPLGQAPVAGEWLRLIRKLQVCVGVDQARQHNRIAEVQHASRGRSTAHRHDSALLDANPSGVDWTEAHRQNMPCPQRQAG